MQPSRPHGPARLGLAALLLFASCGAAERPDRERPDVLLIVVDTLRADHMSLYGYGRETTPALDSLAEHGAVFERAMAGCSWTLPSMAMLFSGAYDGRGSGVLDAPWPSLAEAFQGAGYHTGAVLANPILSGQRDGGDFETGFERGFESFEITPRRFGVPRGVQRQTNGWPAERVVTKAKRLLEAPGPHFVWLQLFEPHFPRMPQRPGLFDGSPDPGPQPALAVSSEERAYIDEERRLYDAEVADADAAIGELLDWLAASGRLENTLVVVTADHGEGLWQRALPAGEQPKKKNEVPRLYSDHGIMLADEQVHVPLLLAGPGVPAGLRLERTISLVDLAPTLRRLADLPVSGAPAETAGRDLFEGQAGPESAVYSFCSRAASLTLEDRWRLVVPSEARARDFGEQPRLFDLELDPLELSPLSAAERQARGAPDPERLARALAALQQLATPAGELDAEQAAERRQLLDDLGYVDQ